MSGYKRLLGIVSTELEKPHVLHSSIFPLQRFLTELAAGKGQLEDIENLAVKYGKISPSKYFEIQTWMEKINIR